MRKVLNAVQWSLVTLLLILGIFLGGSYLPIDGNYKLYLVSAGSMAPSIELGTLIAVIPRDEYRVGDIIVYKKAFRGSDELPTTHRIVNTEVVGGEILYITKGDANVYPDMEPVKMNEIGGKVFFQIPYVQQVIEFVKRPVGFALIVLIPAVWLAADFVLYLKRQRAVVSQEITNETH